MKDFKDIFQDSGSLSKEQLQAYLEGKLTGAELHKVEEQLIDAPFEAEAAEGLAQASDLNYAFEGIHADIDKAASTAGSSAGFNYTPLALAASVALIAVTLVVVWTKMDTSVGNGDMAVQHEATDDDADNDLTPEKDEAPIMATEEAKLEQGNENIVDLEGATLEDDEVTVSMDVPSESEVTEDVPTDLALEEEGESRNDNKRQLDDLKKESPKKFMNTASNYAFQQSQTGKKNAGRAADTMSWSGNVAEKQDGNSNDTRDEMNNGFGFGPPGTKNEDKKSGERKSGTIDRYGLKLYDYSNEYGKDDWKDGLQSKGVPPEYKDKQQMKEAADEDVMTRSTQTFTYDQVLDQAAKDFDAGQYVKSEESWKLIRDNYSDNVNAQFYGGLCNKELNKSDKALTLLKQAEDNKIPVFQEEAIWLQALVYEQKGDTENAQKLFRKVADMKGGFYQERARKKLAK